jgi:putative ABC transport system permease protein
VLGIAFAVVLMGVQYGILHAMLESNTRLLRALEADWVLIHPQRQALMFRPTFPRYRLYQAQAVDGVARVVPVYLDYQAGLWLARSVPLPQRPPARRIRIVGVDPQAAPLTGLDIPAHDWHHLQVPGTALYDRRCRMAPDGTASVYGPLADGIVGELSGRSLTLRGDGFTLGFDFAADGTLIVSERTFAQWIRQAITPPGVDPLDAVDLGLIYRQADSPTPATAATLEALYAAEHDVELLTLAQLIQREQRFWLANTPIGFAFGAGMILGFIVGFVICYQILTNNISDQASQYATVRAIGHTQAFLRQVVTAEALLLAGGGSVVGLSIVGTLQGWLARWTGLPFGWSGAQLAALAVATGGMCWLSARLAARQLEKVDPADVF